MAILSSPAVGRPYYPPGVHVPTYTWFRDSETQEIDWDIQERHLSFLIQSGLDGVVVAGTNGEAVSLTPDEKVALVQLTKKVATENGRPDIPITLGCNGLSTRDTIVQTHLAKDAGANFALVLISSFFHFALDEDALVAFFTEVADQSPLPVMLYNFPGVAAGIDLNSNVLERLGKHPNIVGVKLTCGGIGKVPRVRAAFEPDEFCAVAGSCDWLLPALSVGAVGVVTGIANICPKSCLNIIDLYAAGKHDLASAAQFKMGQTEWAFNKGNLAGGKWAVARLLGYPEGSEHCRRPYPVFVDAEKKQEIKKALSFLLETERELSSKSKHT